MAKLDLPFSPLVGTLWEEAIYMDTALPFSLSSAPKIFSAVADALLWITLLKGVKWALNYLDDFLLFDRPHLRERQSALDIGLLTCSELGWEVHKVGGPSTCIVFLGIEIDSVNSQLRLPTEKLQSLKMELVKWQAKNGLLKKRAPLTYRSAEPCSKGGQTR